MSDSKLPSLTTFRLPDTQAASDRSPALPFYLMSVDDAGRSTLAAELLRGFQQKSVGGGAAPQWLLDWPGEVVGVKFAVLPVGWVGEWHESPHPQWVVPLSGSWFLETADGQRAEMGPGDLHYGQDQGTKDKRGHRSGQLGDEPCVQLMLQFAARPDWDRLKLEQE